MINLNFSINNPFSSRFNNVFNRHGLLAKHTAWEFEILETNTLLAFEFRFTTRTDHAGLCIGFGVFGHEFQFQIYDTRHWDNTYGVYK